MPARREGPPDDASATTAAVLDASRTWRVPAGPIRASSSLHVSVIDGAIDDGAVVDSDFDGDFGEATTPSLARPQVVVMEEKPSGLVEGLIACGFHVRAAASGLEAMTLVTQHQVVAVVVGPGDAERRRVLTVAVRQRHRQVAVIHVLTRVDEASKRAAAIVGASAVLAWPLPSIDEVLAVIPLTTMPPSSSLAPFAEETGELPLLSADASAINSDEAITNLVRRAKSSSDVFAPSPSSSPSAASPRASIAQRVRIPIDDDVGDDLATAPRLRPVPAPLAQPVVPADSDDLEALLASVPALVPLLVDSAAFLEALQAHHVRGADGHARAVHQAVRLLTRLSVRLDVDVDD